MSLLKDVRFGVRSLVKRPGFALVAVVTLALGIGANTAIFTVIDAALLRSLPYREPSRLVHLWETKRSRDFEQREASYPDFLGWRAGRGRDGELLRPARRARRGRAHLRRGRGRPRRGARRRARPRPLGRPLRRRPRRRRPAGH